MAFQREVAWRLFAREYNQSHLELKGEGERAPSYLVSPLGAKVNRLFVVGVLTRCEPVGAAGDMWRAQVSDPTGVFHIYSGQFQPEATAVLKELSPPCFVAVVGKSRIYRPDGTRTLVSVTPELVKEVDRDTRDAWVLETAQRTEERLEASAEAAQAKDPRTLATTGYPAALAEGACLATAHYGADVIKEYRFVLQRSLDYLLSGSSGFLAEESQEAPTPAFVPAGELETVAVPTSRIVEETSEVDQKGLALQERAFALIGSLDGGKGAPWEEVLAALGKEGASETEVEEALNALMDKGRLFEPILGRLKAA